MTDTIKDLQKRVSDVIGSTPDKLVAAYMLAHLQKLLRSVGENKFRQYRVYMEFLQTFEGKKQ